MKLGYSKINFIDTHKRRSLDFSSDFPARPNSATSSKTHLNQIQIETKTCTTQVSSSSSSSPSPRKTYDEVEEVEDEVAEISRKSADHRHKAAFGPVKCSNAAAAAAVLRRNSSVSSMSAVKRAFSMRRSSSVSEGYSRIHDQSVTLASPVDDEDENEGDKTRSAKKKNRGSKILKACKRLFGL